VSASITIGGVAFDRAADDRDADVRYLHVGDPRTAVDFDESPEGHALRYDATGRLVGVTLVDARRLLEADGAITVTVPQPRRRGDARDLAAAVGLAGESG
jgi:YD repeat-containing protein